MPAVPAAGRPPSIDALARSLADIPLPHALLVDAARQAVAAGEPQSARRRAEEIALALLGPVINATGVLLHTNLGRAPLGPLAGRAGPAPDGVPTGSDGAAGPVRYANLELDLGTGRRGSRQSHAASLLARLCGAESALVVNNGAGAVLLVLTALARGGRVVVSRGELVEIGGGFRIPEVMAASGADLVEVGTTNRTRLADYEAALDQRTALVLKVHQSNYRVVGFTEAVGVAELAGLGPPVVFDIGSGLLDAEVPWLPGGPPSWLAGEPAARQALEAGAALVTFSGDKLLGGPQAGVVAGRADLVAACARHPLYRALRPGGLVLAGLQETALAYLRRDAGRTVPFWCMASAPVEALWSRAEAVAKAAGGGATVVASQAVAGGGSVPGLGIPSAAVALAGDHTGRLRLHRPPVVARLAEGRTLADLRTVDPADDEVLAEALAGPA